MTTEHLPTDQFPGFLGIESVSFDDGRVTAELPIRGEHFAPNGFVHAAVIVGLADTLCGYGCLASLPEGASGCTTVELKTNFLGAAREGKLTAAVFRCTQLVLWPRG